MDIFLKIVFHHTPLQDYTLNIASTSELCTVVILVLLIGN
jgi:hypothetical protein